MASLAEPAAALAEADTDSEHTAPEPPAAAAVVTEEQRGQFLTALRALGGSSGNMSLRAALGWDEAAYNAVKDGLVAADGLVLGRGRGGSVAVP
jgi:hypothetical protein